MLRPPRSGPLTRRLLGTAAGLGVALAAYVTCTAPQAQAVSTLRVTPDSLEIVSAVSEYGVHEPEGAVVALHVVARNATAAPTRSTMVRWSPEFAATFTFMSSEPPAANALIDGAGWGVAQVAGLPAREEQSIALWFRVADGAAAPVQDLFPRVQVLAEGEEPASLRVVGERVVIPLHAPERLKLRAQHAVDQSAVAQLVEVAPFLPASAQGVFGLAVGFAVLLSGITLAGVAATLRLAAGTRGPNGP